MIRAARKQDMDTRLADVAKEPLQRAAVRPLGPGRLRVDSYESPDGPGFILDTEVDDAGQTFARQVNVGPWRHQLGDWYQKLPPP